MPWKPATVPAAVNGDGPIPSERRVHCPNQRMGRRRFPAVSQKTCLAHIHLLSSEKRREALHRPAPDTCVLSPSGFRTMIARSLLFLLLTSVLEGRSQDTLRYGLPEVPVSAKRFEHSGTERLTDTSTVNLMTARTAGEVLSREPGIFIRNYGPGNISTISIRGMNAVHTPVFWHGLPLNSPMLGLSDLSILPPFLTGRMSIQSSGAAPLNGSGAISASIQLGDTASRINGCHIGLLASGGSFGEQQTGVEVELNQGGISNRTRLYTSGSTNDFPYTSPDGRRMNQTHAAMNQMGFTHDLIIRSKRNQLESHLWYLESERDLPPHMLSISSNQEQADASLRWISSWTRTGNRSHLRVMGGMNRERLRFSDPSVRLDDRSRSMNALVGVEGGYRIQPLLRLEGQLAGQHAIAHSDGYASDAIQQQWNFTGKAITERKDLTMMLALRYGFAAGKPIPLLPSLSIRRRLNRLLSVHGEAARVYRIPTLNDIFWKPGGNPELKPERGWSASTGLQLEDASRNITWSVRSSFFLINLIDAITWLPDDQAIYRATNMHALLSKGIESTMNLAWTSPIWKVSAAWSPTLVSSVILKTDPAFSELTGRQLPYMPRLAHKGSLAIEYRGFGIRYLFQYNGYRYTTEDHGNFLPPYSVSDLIFSWSRRGKKSGLTMTMAVKNMFSEDYQVMAWRAMPGRSFQAGIVLLLPEKQR